MLIVCQLMLKLKLNQMNINFNSHLHVHVHCITYQLDYYLYYLSLSTNVIIELRYGICVRDFSDKATIT